MKAYFIRRFLLIPITFIGITAIVFTLSRFLPGGPIDQMLKQQNQSGDTGGGGSPAQKVDENELEALEEEFDYDLNIPHAYLNWLGVTPKRKVVVKSELPAARTSVTMPDSSVLTVARRGANVLSVADSKGENVLSKGWKAELIPAGSSYEKDGENKISSGWTVRLSSPSGDAQVGEFPQAPRFQGLDKPLDRSVEANLVLLESGEQIIVNVDPNDPTKILSSTYLNNPEKSPSSEGWDIYVQTPDQRLELARKRFRLKTKEEVGKSYNYRIIAQQTGWSGLLQGNLGRSQKYQDDVLDMILGRMPIALYFGILSTIIIYGVCIPLGIVKAIKHRTLVDNLSSILIFVGYSIPGFALGGLLLVYLGARENFFPLFGLVSENFDSLSLFEKLKDLAHHTVLPLIAYVITGFAMLTMMMKNSLMDNLSADYVRTAVAKGVSFNQAVFKHAFRNSFIPIATGLGGLITIFVSGSLLIERVFDIQGFGLLSFNAIMDIDAPVIMGTLTFSSLLMLLGNILSDLIVAWVDPRIKFN